ncbi:cadmium resistance protein [Lapidilactobacillus dextrinicus DSM 20335]|uniref:Cadmium resistance protein n=1 Tax=Lapidilactobacillus dextrinicus DSM 20335 TaxID=1423738 RepID=A0A0R2BJ34_9LACO|nr:CadD family cadmium resistance transporter [Lapidilactobacillus dextrinicus]KRM79551.1 cadmium resistance protein [Lapidilactobacillus dextrinicus DSM 20335]QFG46617.1 CadD family cadmium resistance transporter [Lapidilactobacillus dextrinicus]
MFKTVISAVIVYSSTALDLFVILMLLFGKYQSTAAKRRIYIGQFLGSWSLIAVSLFFALILHFVPAKWLLGFLGLIPIYFGVKSLFENEDETAEAQEKISQSSAQKLISTVALMTFASCGADNIGMFVPYFVAQNTGQLITVLITFTVCIFLLVFFSNRLSHVKLVEQLLEHFGKWLMAIIYVGLGIMIIIESGTIQHLMP